MQILANKKSSLLIELNERYLQGGSLERREFSIWDVEEVLEIIKIIVKSHGVLHALRSHGWHLLARLKKK
jgi:hypothetical protein